MNVVFRKGTVRCSMKIKIPYRSSRIWQGIAYGISATVLLLMIIVLFRSGNPAAAGCATLSLLFFLFPLWMFINIIVRFVRNTGCFSITPDGLENISHPLSIGAIGLPVTIRLFPWSCIESFRIDRTAGGDRLVLMPKDQAEFPKGYSPFVISLLEREQNRGVCGFTFDSRSADADPEQLLRLLQKELDAYRRRDYPAGWPVPPEGSVNTDKTAENDF